MTQPQTYYRDEQDDTGVSGVVVVETGNEGVRVTENRETGWCAPFWMPESEFSSSVVDATEKVGLLPDEKFSAVVDRATEDV